MSDDELEHLRAILAQNHIKPKGAGIIARISRAAKELFTRPKNGDVRRMEKKVSKKNAA